MRTQSLHPPTHSHSAQNPKKALNAGYLSFSNRNQWKETDRLGHKPSALSGSGCWLLRLREQREREGPLRPEWIRLTRPIQNPDSFAEQKIEVAGMSGRSEDTPIAQMQLSDTATTGWHEQGVRRQPWWQKQGSLTRFWWMIRLLIFKWKVCKHPEIVFFFFLCSVQFPFPPMPGGLHIFQYGSVTEWLSN